MDRQTGTRIQMPRARRSVGWVLLLALTACDRAPVPVAHTVSYFREHENERREILKGCHEDPGILAQTPECVNARKANLVQDIGSFRKLPPLGSPPPAHMRSGTTTSDQP